jgi:hypothetical protein
MLTLAPEIAAPEGSVTKPLISPLVCARPTTVDMVSNNRPPKIWKTKRVLFVILPPSFPLVFEERSVDLLPGAINRATQQPGLSGIYSVSEQLFGSRLELNEAL